ncbi:S-adenosyl-L-methionine-dependent methyltransferase [Panaeolus papilionaceus]|nr:S-adenosyl-L-methionine-dependent methyltransferase [Panaeolus papilionaceus]
MSSELPPSKLGTKEYWDNVYDEEVKNFEEIGEEGEIWFGIESVEKMVKWAEENVPSQSKPLTLEIGSGNGTLLFGLLEAGYDASTLFGIDYSAGAVKLAKEIAETKQGEDVTFHECDFLTQDPPSPFSDAATVVWDLILDKGTYDAIALGPKDSEGHSPAKHYPERMARLLKPGGHFLITSCNFTEDELKTAFRSPELGLEYHSRIQHPTFSFGGHTGSIVSSVAFRKTPTAQ